MPLQNRTRQPGEYLPNLEGQRSHSVQWVAACVLNGHRLTEALAAMGGAFEFTRLAAANLREKDDSWNPAIGGFFGGAVAGMKC